MPVRFKFAWLTAAALLLTGPLTAQVKTGDLTTSLVGTISPGYSASYGNQTSSTHSWNVGGAGTLSGSYYTPNFLSFNVGYFLNQSRANSNFQSITNSSGVNATANLFSGTHFPGSVTYSNAWDSEGNYAIPGMANFVTHGNSDTFGVNWSESLPDVPSVSAGFQMGASQYSIYGSNDEGQNHFKSGTVHSSYRLAGYNLGGYISRGSSDSAIPQVISGGQMAEINNRSTNMGFSVSHPLPLHGSVSGGLNRSNYDSNYLGTTSSGTIDLLSTMAVVRPSTRISLSTSVDYSDNLSGQVIQSIVNAGGVVPAVNTRQSSDSLDVLGVASYTPSDDAQVSISAEHRAQTYLGQTYGVNSYSASGGYSRRLYEGTLNSSGMLTANTSDTQDGSTLGFSVTENYAIKVAGWHLSGNFNYAQNVQTLLVTYMNSFYNFSGSARRNWGKFNFSAAAAASHTALTDQSGTSNRSQSYSSSMGYGSWITASGSYSKASGEALLTGAGLVPAPVPPVIPSSLLNMFGGESYSAGVASSPVKKLLLQASYARGMSNTSTGAYINTNENREMDALVQYHYRKLDFMSGFTRLEQGFSQSGGPPQVISSYYVGASRWFKFW